MKENMFALAMFYFSKLIIVYNLQIVATQPSYVFRKNRSPTSVTSYKLKLGYHHLTQLLYNYLLFILYYERSGPQKIDVRKPDRKDL